MTYALLSCDVYYNSKQLDVTSFMYPLIAFPYRITLFFSLDQIKCCTRYYWSWFRSLSFEVPSCAVVNTREVTAPTNHCQIIPLFKLFFFRLFLAELKAGFKAGVLVTIVSCDYFYSVRKKSYLHSVYSCMLVCVQSTRCCSISHGWFMRGRRIGIWKKLLKY